MLVTETVLLSAQYSLRVLLAAWGEKVYVKSVNNQFLVVCAVQKEKLNCRPHLRLACILFNPILGLSYSECYGSAPWIYRAVSRVFGK